MSQVQNRTPVNGVDVQKLMDTIGVLRKKPDLAKFQFRVRNKWMGADHNRSTIQDFYGAGEEQNTRSEPYVFDCGEPPVLCGNESGANPVEYLLHGLAGCVTTTTAFHAAARGIEIQSIESEIAGDIDVQGFLGLRDDVPRGYQKIRIKMKIKSDADAEKLQELAGFSPVYNTVTHATPVEIVIEKQP